MKVILIRDVEKLGRASAVVDVSDGYARNYLFPRNLALPATKGNIDGYKKAEDRFSQKRKRLAAMHTKLAEKINNLTIKTTIKTGLDGKSFGSITSGDLVEMLKAEGVEIDKKALLLDEPIRHPGVYDIRVHLAEGMNAVFKLVLLEQGA
jgi:large subunit ribosomal protein L9